MRTRPTSAQRELPGPSRGAAPGASRAAARPAPARRGIAEPGAGLDASALEPDGSFDVLALDRAAALSERVAVLTACGTASRQRSVELRARATLMADELARVRNRLAVVLAAAGRLL